MGRSLFAVVDIMLSAPFYVSNLFLLKRAGKRANLQEIRSGMIHEGERVVMRP
jgi:hypothetical protein